MLYPVLVLLLSCVNFFSLKCIENSKTDLGIQTIYLSSINQQKATSYWNESAVKDISDHFENVQTPAVMSTTSSIRLNSIYRILTKEIPKEEPWYSHGFDYSEENWYLLLCDCNICRISQFYRVLNQTQKQYEP